MRAAGPARLRASQGRHASCLACHLSSAHQQSCSRKQGFCLAQTPPEEGALKFRRQAPLDLQPVALRLLFAVGVRSLPVPGHRAHVSKPRLGTLHACSEAASEQGSLASPVLWQGSLSAGSLAHRRPEGWRTGRLDADHRLRDQPRGSWGCSSLPSVSEPLMLRWACTSCKCWLCCCVQPRDASAVMPSHTHASVASASSGPRAQHSSEAALVLQVSCPAQLTSVLPGCCPFCG